MPQISTHELKGLPLRVHDFLAGVPLHDAPLRSTGRLSPGPDELLAPR